MSKPTPTKKKARFDLRLSKAQKTYFEKAARYGGYRNLTDFVTRAVQEKAGDIMAQRERVLASEEDKKTFFEEIAKPQAPNRALTDLSNEFEFLFSE